MRRHAKAPSAGSTSGIGSSRGIFGRVFAIRDTSGDARGSGASSPARIALAICATLVLVAASAVPAQAATPALLREIPAIGGTTGGALRDPVGVAVNNTGAGGVGAGDTYVLETTNNRVSEFTDAGAFVRTFGYDVVESGSDNTGANEVQKLLVKASGGKFALTYNGKITGATGTASWTNPTTTINLSNVTNGAFTAGQVLTTNGTGVKVGTTISSISGPASTPTLTLSQATEGSTAQTSKTLTGSDLPYNASAAEVEAALNGLSSIGGVGGSVTVSRAELSATEFEYTITFGGTLAGNNLPAMTTTPAGLQGTKTATVSITVPGGGAEICKASVPSDVCKQGVSSSLAGSLNGATGIAVEQATGNVYVYETQNRRVSVFSAKGVFEGAFGWKVKAGGEAAAELQFCTTAGSGCQAGENTALGGGFASSLSPRGVAFDSAGNLYVADSGNNRIDAFHPTVNGSEEVTAVTFVKAFGYDVVASGPDNAGTAEVQSIKVAATSGTFTLSYEGQTTSSLPYSASSTEVETALNALSKINTAGGSVSVSGGPGDATGAHPYVVTFGGSLRGINVGQITVNTANLGVAVGTQLTCIGGPASATLSYQWLRNGVPAPGATSANYTTVAGDEGKPVQCQVFASESIGAVALTTPATVVSPVPATAPPVSATPTISGATGVFGTAAVVGDTLTCNPGAWAGSPTFAYQWYNRGVSLSGATSSTYTVQPADVPGSFQCVAVGTNVSGSVAAASQKKNTSPAANPAAPVATASVASGTDGSTTTEGGPAPEVCVAANGDVCKKGAEGTEPGELSASLSSLSIDSSDNIFAISSSRLQKFDSSGMVVDPSFGPSSGECSTNSSKANSVAVSPETGHVFIFEERATTAPKTAQICELESSGNEVEAFPATPLHITGQASGMAVGSGGRIYAVWGGNSSFPSAFYTLGPVPPPSCSEVTDVTDVMQTTATLKGKVCVPSPGGEGFDTVYHFEVSPDNGFHWTNFPSSDKSVGSVAGPHFVEEPATGLQPNSNYLVRLVAATGPSVTSPTKTFFTHGAPPTILEGHTADATSTSIKVAGTINPNNSATNYRFEYGTSTSYGKLSPAEFEPFLGSGGTPQPVSANLSGLKPGTTYHWRLTATNASGKTTGEDHQFTTYEEPGSLNAAGLPDNRAVELVTPPDKRPAGVVTPFLNTQLSFQVAEDGERISYPVLNGLGDTETGFETIYTAGRSALGWESSELSAPSRLSSPSEDSQLSRLKYLSPVDLKCGLLESFQALTDNVPEVDIANGVTNLYRWNAANDTYTLITDKIPLNPAATTFPAYQVAGASQDCSRIVFHSAYTFITGVETYEWDQGTLRAIVPAPLDSEQLQYLENPVSSSGRLFYTATVSGPGDAKRNAIFVRKSPTETVDASLPTNGPSLGATYETASPDGSHVFFLANYGIASTSSKGPTESCADRAEQVGTGQGQWKTTACDLYDYNVETGQLRDISADPNDTDERGAVVQGVMAVSDDGSVVYFAALGQLVPGKGRTYAQNAAGGYANVYRYQSGTPFTYIGSATSADLKTGPQSPKDGALIHNPKSWTSQTNRDGSYFLFVSHDNMTDTNPAEVEEAYLYSEATGTIECVSCPQDGTAPRPGGYGVIALPFGPAPNATATSPSSLSEDGRVVFTVEDALTPDAVEGHGAGSDPESESLENNIYEWHQGQVSLLATGQARALGMGGPDGRDVFLQTTVQMVPQDFDFGYDVYDLRSGGGFAPPPEPPASCDPAADQCQGSPSSAPATPRISSGVTVPGNPPPASGPARKHHKKVHHKKVHHKKHHRKRSKKKNNKNRSRAADSNRGGAK